MAPRGDSLLLECPNCGDMGPKKPAKRVYSRKYSWSKEKSDFFKRITGRDIDYRERTRECLNCEVRFNTIEMASENLDKLISEIVRLENK